MLEIIENHKRKITIIREMHGDFKIDTYLSSKFIICSPDLKDWLEGFFNKNIKWVIPNWKDIFVFCFYDYQWLWKLIDELEWEGHTDIKSSDLYTYQDNAIHKL